MKGNPGPRIRKKSQRAGFKTYMNEHKKEDDGNLRSNKQRRVSYKFLFDCLALRLITKFQELILIEDRFNKYA